LTLLTSRKIFNKCYLQMILKKGDQSYIVGMRWDANRRTYMTTFRRIGVFGYGEEHLIELNQITVVLFRYRTMNIAYLLALYNNTLLNYLRVICYCRRWLIPRCMLCNGNLTSFWFINDWLLHHYLDKSIVFKSIDFDGR
jgi:hypothetical protein